MKSKYTSPNNYETQLFQPVNSELYTTNRLTTHNAPMGNRYKRSRIGPRQRMQGGTVQIDVHVKRVHPLTEQVPYRGTDKAVLENSKLSCKNARASARICNVRNFPTYDWMQEGLGVFGMISVSSKSTGERRYV